MARAPIDDATIGRSAQHLAVLQEKLRDCAGEKVIEDLGCFPQSHRLRLEEYGLGQDFLLRVNN